MANNEELSNEGLFNPSRPERRKAAEQGQLDFELDFYAGILQRDPSYVDVLRVHGNNLTSRGLYHRGLQVDKCLARLLPNDPVVHYNLACSYALVQNADPAIAALRRAIELGYTNFYFMEHDPDLKGLRRDPRYRRLLKECGVI